MEAGLCWGGDREEEGKANIVFVDSDRYIGILYTVSTFL